MKKINPRSKTVEFLYECQKLKSTLRHCWTENPNRQESVAEHTWMMSLMAVAFAPNLRKKVNLEKVLKMVVFHDLGEAITGDIPAFDRSHATKNEAEEKAMEVILSFLPQTKRDEVLKLFEEYKERKTPQALFVKMLDVIDVMFQHLISSLSTWSKEEFSFNLQRKSIPFFEKEPFMLDLYNRIHDGLEEKVKKGKKGD